MRFALALGAMACFGLPAAVQASDPAQQAVIHGPPVKPEALALSREIVDNGFPQEVRLKMMSGAMDAMMNQMMTAMNVGAGDPGARAILDRHLAGMRTSMLATVEKHIPALFDSYAFGYARTFSVEELRAIRDFSATPAGAAFISRTPEILSDPDVAAANQAFIKEAMAVLPQFGEALRADLTAYYRKHPEAAGN